MLSLLLLLLGVRAGAARIPGQIPADGIAGINVDGSASVGSVGHGAEPPVGFPGAEPLIPGLEECVAGGRFNVNLVPYLSQVFLGGGHLCAMLLCHTLAVCGLYAPYDPGAGYSFWVSWY